MRIIVYGGEDRRRIEDRLGCEDYQYHFVIEAFRPVLERIGLVDQVGHLDDAEPIRTVCETRGESCVVLSFVPPHKTTLFTRVPLLPVFGWEYENIPFETWDGQPKHDWRMVLQTQGRAIALSSHASRVVRATMGESFPCLAVPPPVFDRMAALRDRIAGRLPTPTALDVEAFVIDSRTPPSLDSPPPGGRPFPRLPPSQPPIDAAPGFATRLLRSRRFAPLLSRTPRLRRLAENGCRAAAASEAPGWPDIDATRRPASRVSLEGVVYLGFIEPSTRENWEDLLTAFTWGLREKEDATLVVKIVASDTDDYWESCLKSLYKQPAFACRVLLLEGFLDDGAKGRLLESASYVVSAARGERAALPLLEGMSVGRPAIAPDHTALADFMTSVNAFPVASSPEVTAFVHDSRGARRTMWHLPRWDCLRDAFRESYRVIKDEPHRWLAMSANAIATQREFCGDATVEPRLRDFLGVQESEPALRLHVRDLGFIPIADAAVA